MLISINRIIRTLIISDLVLNLAWGLLAPIFAIFILEGITLSDPIRAAEVAGMASLIYWVVKSFAQIPISRFLDGRKGEYDDFWFMFIGTFMAGLVPFGYMISSAPAHIYLVQIFHGLANALLVPAWYAIFTRHIDKGKEAFEWGMESTFLGIGTGIAGGLGGLLVPLLGFEVIFILAGSLNLAAAVILLLVYENIFPRDEIFPKFFPKGIQQ